MSLPHYAYVAELLEYPSETFFDRLKNIGKVSSERYPEAVEELRVFEKLLPQDIYELQELYCRSFEVQPLTSLYVGYVLFGDDYKRGEMLANLNVEHRKVGNELSSELPDFLPNVLKLITKLAEKGDKETLEDVAVRVVAPAVKKMIAEYEPDSLKAKDEVYKKEFQVLIEASESVTAFSHCLKAIHTMLEKDFTLIEMSDEIKDTSFFKFIKKELEIEAKGDTSLGNAAACATSCSTSCS
ncbi:MAG: nitrate reductase molybdenum cofactor assembly chaperone NarJ/NarW [Campylobacterota bacterium]|nr:nitrate reductase molybdenum cofactor assembly chaperone NarJ/NarW [Campylobacterota bacterium]